MEIITYHKYVNKLTCGFIVFLPTKKVLKIREFLNLLAIKINLQFLKKEFYCTLDIQKT